MENTNETFTYTYSPEEQKEIKRIRDKYIPREETKLEKIKRLDASVFKKGVKWVLIIGTISALVMGIGMSMVMSEFVMWVGEILKLTDIQTMILGICVGVVGIIGVLLTYPVYKLVTKRQRKKVAAEIMQLSEELIKSVKCPNVSSGTFCINI